MKPFKCPECGGEVRPMKRSGRMARHQMMTLEIPESIVIPECDRCGELYIDAKAARAVDRALRTIFNAKLSEMARDTIADLVEHVSQKEVESLLGLAQGYLSHLKAGRRRPSAHLVAELGALAVNPKKRIAELRRFWTEHSSDALDHDAH